MMFFLFFCLLLIRITKKRLPLHYGSKQVIRKDMPPKYRIYVKKKKVVRKNFWSKRTDKPVRVITSRVLSRVRKLISPPVKQPLCTTISTEGLSQEWIDRLKDLEAKGLLPPMVTWIESKPRGLDDKLKYALAYLHSEEAKLLGCKISRGYDYAWIKIAIDCEKMPNRYSNYQFMSTPKFVEFIKYLGFTDIAGSKTINKALTHAKWISDDNSIAFHHIHLSISERKRRNLIALKFLEIMNEV